MESESEDAEMKIIDLGLGQFFNDNEHLSRLKGSIYYMAPELIKMKYNHKVDIWSCGVILYILICGKAPFDAKKYDKHGQVVLDHEEIQAKILEGTVNFGLEAFRLADPDIKELIKTMLTYDPKKRPEAVEVLKHPWFYRTNENSQRIDSIYIFYIINNSNR